MKTWITNGYVYRYGKHHMERKDLCIEDGKICEICSPGHGEREGDVYDASGKYKYRDLLMYILMEVVV